VPPPGFNYLLTDNRKLNQTFGDFETPVIAVSEIEIDGYSESRVSFVQRQRHLAVASQNSM
jgi:hypothetical protein